MSPKFLQSTQIEFPDPVSLSMAWEKARNLVKIPLFFFYNKP